MNTSNPLQHHTVPTAQRLTWRALRAMSKDYLNFATRLQHQNDNITRFSLLNVRVTHVFNPLWMRNVLVDQNHNLIRWERATQVFSLSMGQSVLVSEGDQWQRQRRMLQPGFSPKRVAGYTQLMVQAAREALDGLALEPKGQEVDMEQLMTHITLDVISRTLFTQPTLHQPKALTQAIQTLSHFGYSQLFLPFNLPMWLPLPSVLKAKRALRVLQGFIKTNLAKHEQDARAHPEWDDLVTMFRAARDPQHPDVGMDSQELYDQTALMFLAGHETTASAMTWWCGLMAQHPEVAQRVQDEVRHTLQGQDPSPETVADMPWLQASLKESLRLYPPALIFTRKACTDLQIGPITIPKGDLIAMTPYVVHRDPRWYESPEAFRPERFLPGAPEIERGAWIPFGTGPRVCMGQHFAMMEMAVVAAMLLQRFNLVWPTDTPWPHTKMAVSLRPETGMKLMLVPRH